MSAVKWVKIQTDIYRNRKINLIRKERNGDTYVLLWLYLIILAGESNANGKLMVSETVPFTEESVSKVCEIRKNLVSNALELFKKYEMITIENGVIELLGWYEYQNADALETQRENARIRQRKWYDSHKKPNKPNANLTESSKLDLALSNAVDVDVDVEEDVESFNNRKKELKENRTVSFAEINKAMASPNYQRLRTYRNFADIHYGQYAGLIAKMSDAELGQVESLLRESETSGEDIVKTLKKFRELINPKGEK